MGCCKGGKCSESKEAEGCRKCCACRKLLIPLLFIAIAFFVYRRVPSVHKEVNEAIVYLKGLAPTIPLEFEVFVNNLKQIIGKGLKCTETMVTKKFPNLTKPWIYKVVFFSTLVVIQSLSLLILRLVACALYKCCFMKMLIKFIRVASMFGLTIALTAWLVLREQEELNPLKWFGAHPETAARIGCIFVSLYLVLVISLMTTPCRAMQSIWFTGVMLDAAYFIWKLGSNWTVSKMLVEIGHHLKLFTVTCWFMSFIIFAVQACPKCHGKKKCCKSKCKSKCDKKTKCCGKKSKCCKGKSKKCCKNRK
ncbi:hypothetical protein PCE1_001627 [Barthelona sp. PCE]